MDIKQYHFNLPIKANKVYHIQGQMVQNDADSNKLVFHLTDDNKDFSITGYTNVTVHILKPDNNQYVDSLGMRVEVIDVAKKMIGITLGLGAVNVAGVCQGTIEVYAGAIKLTSSRFSYDVVPNVQQSADETLVTNYPIVQSLIEQVNNAAAEVNNAVASENVRVGNENIRETAEGTRNTNENTRKNNETSRQTAETARVTAESGRVTAETSRATAETNRNTSENTRIAQETARGTSEGTRQNNETTRQANEATRQAEFLPLKTKLEGVADGATKDVFVTEMPLVANRNNNTFYHKIHYENGIRITDWVENHLGEKFDIHNYATKIIKMNADGTFPITTCANSYIKGLTIKGNTKLYKATKGTQTWVEIPIIEVMDTINYDYKLASVGDVDAIDGKTYILITVNDVLQRVEISDYLRMLPNLVADEAINNTITRKMRNYTLQESDIVSLATTPTNYNFAVVNPSGIKTPTNNIDGATLITKDGMKLREREYTTSGSIEYVGGYNTNTNNSIYFLMDKTITTLAQAKTALVGTQVTYQLATPIYEQIDITAIQTVQGNNTIACVSSVLPKEQTITINMQFTENAKRFEIINDEVIPEGNLFHVYASAGTKSRSVEIHTRSGVNGGLPTGTTNARESLVIHHYNDNNPIQIDNVGRDNVMLTLKQGNNSSMSSHNEVGRGSYINFDRSGVDLPTPLVVEHLGRISPEDWWNVGMLAVAGTWGLTLVGKRSSVNKVQTVLPLLIYSKGLDANTKGADALRIHSTDYGGVGLRITNRPSSNGTLLQLEGLGTTSGQPLININVKGNNSAINIYNNGLTNAMMLFGRSNAIFGDLLRATNESGTPIFKVEGDGKSISLTDSATGVLKKLIINNGIVEVV